ncbi:hypothetical protein ACJJTC_010105 [Scirpophaga incertulas]
MKEHICNTKIDKFLFGENFADTLKVAKAVNKSSTDLKQQNRPIKKTAPQLKSHGIKNSRAPAPARRQVGPPWSREPAPSAGRPAPLSKRSPPLDKQPQHHGQPEIDCRDIIRSALLRREVPESSVDIMIDSIAQNSIQQYSVYIKKWCDYCHKNNLLIYDIRIMD